MDIAVVDDASTDGTLKSLHDIFPDILTINCGGSSYWAGSMRYGVKHFWSNERYTHLLVFNDDITIFQHSISKLIDVAIRYENQFGVVAVGAMVDSVKGIPTYSGMKRIPYRPSIYLDRVKPTLDAQVVDTLNMNLALISKSCLARNELIRSGFIHSLADFDFGLRASKNSAKVILAPNFLGECSRNSRADTWEDIDLPFLKRWDLILGPKGLPLYPRLIYLRSHARYVWPFIYFWPYARLIISHFLLSVTKSSFFRR
jgi:GT2 family glycosyltransferase